jgi:hypothetical protein
MEYRKVLLNAASLLALTAAAGQTSANAAAPADDLAGMPKSPIAASVGKSTLLDQMAKAARAAQGQQQLDEEQELFKVAQNDPRRRRNPRAPDEIGQVPGGGGAPGGGIGS